MKGKRVKRASSRLRRPGLNPDFYTATNIIKDGRAAKAAFFAAGSFRNTRRAAAIPELRDKPSAENSSRSNGLTYKPSQINRLETCEKHFVPTQRDSCDMRIGATEVINLSSFPIPRAVWLVKSPENGQLRGREEPGDFAERAINGIQVTRNNCRASHSGPEHANCSC